MLATGNDYLRDPGPCDEAGFDPEVWEARMIADAARSRLLACVASPQEAIDLAEAQRMLDALRDARVIAGDAEDRVLVHRGLLTAAEAECRAAARRPAPRRAQIPVSAREASRVTSSAASGGVHVIPAQPGRVAAPLASESQAATRAIVLALLQLGVGLAGAVLARRLWHGKE